MYKVLINHDESELKRNGIAIRELKIDQFMTTDKWDRKSALINNESVDFFKRNAHMHRETISFRGIY